MDDLIVLSNAHCMEAKGAGEKSLFEYDYSCCVNKMIKEHLDNNSIEVMIIDGGSGDAKETLKKKISAINSISPTLAIENHLNSFFSSEAHGSEVLCYPGSIEGKKAASNIQQSFGSFLPLAQRGVKDMKDLAFLSQTKCTAVITEPLFLTSHEDFKFTECSEWIKAIASMISFGIFKYLLARKA